MAEKMLKETSMGKARLMSEAEYEILSTGRKNQTDSTLGF